METIHDFNIEYDGVEDKFYLSKGYNRLQTFYGEYALIEYLNDEYGLYGPQVIGAIHAAQ